MAFDLDKFMKDHPNSKISSAYLKLNLSDWQKGLILAFLSPIAYTIGNAAYSWLNGSAFVVDWHDLLKVSLSTGFAYLSKNLLTQPSIQIPVTKEQQKVDEILMPPTSK